MDTKFGEYVKAKRLEKEVNLRKLAELLGIVPAYMSDIEKGRRYPPDKDKLYKIAEVLHLTESESNEMFDLAALAKENTVSPDLPEYIMGSEKARVALRMARDTNAGEKVWQEVIDMLEAREKGDSDN